MLDRQDTEEPEAALTPLWDVGALVNHSASLRPRHDRRLPTSVAASLHALTRKR
jgi:hypothetical protein